MHPPVLPDFLRLATRVLRPTRPGLAAARAAVAGIADAGAAWSALVARGMIAGAWAYDRRRSFEHAGVVSRRPPTVEACIALAGDRSSVTDAEAHARAFAARMTPWGGGADVEVRWRVGRLTRHDSPATSQEPTAALHGQLLAVHEGAETTEWDTEAAWVVHADVPRQRWPDSLHCADPQALGRFTREISASELWLSAALYGYRLAGRPVAELPDPFAPLFAIWGLGYAVDEVTGDAVVLVAPPLDDDRRR